MKIVRLSSGLGNAMFQYCIYLQLKKMYKDEKIYVDTSYYELIRGDKEEIYAKLDSKLSYI